MNKNNGYFELLTKGNETYLKLYPAKDNGKLITFEEVSQYLAKAKLDQYDTITIKRALQHLTTVSEVKVADYKIEPIHESVEIKQTPDRMYAFAKFFPPADGGRRLEKEDILFELGKASIKSGILLELIDGFLTEKEYFIEYLVAKGSQPVEGNNAFVTYHFNLNHDGKPTMNEDGTVDFHKLNIFSQVAVGDLLATLTPPVHGNQGEDISGRILLPKAIKKVVLKYGKNVSISEDGLQLFALSSGHVKLDGDKVVVYNNFDVVADVDASTGDIEYDGDVHIKGNVRTNFTVRATGNIEVNGVVEGASLIAGGHIILRRGIQGMNRGLLDAKGNVIAKFIENSTVKAGGFIETDAILHSNVDAKGEIRVSGRKGLITGGEVRSGCEISAKTIGSHMGTVTNVEVGTDPAVSDRLIKVNSEINKTKEDIVKLDQMVNLFSRKHMQSQNLSKDKLALLQSATKNKILLEEKSRKLYAELDEIYEVLDRSNFGKIKILSIGYPGVRITIGSARHYLREEVKYSQFYRDGAEIKITVYT